MRPALPRYTASIVLTIDLSATDAEHAGQRVEAIADLAARKLEATIRATRVGRPEVTHIGIHPPQRPREDIAVERLLPTATTK